MSESEFNTDLINSEPNTGSSDIWETPSLNNLSTTQGETSETGGETKPTTYNPGSLWMTEDNSSRLTQALGEVGATDEVLAESLFMLAMSATKEISIGDWEMVTVADNRIRLDALKMILTVRGDLREKWNSVKAQTHVNYILVK